MRHRQTREASPAPIPINDPLDLFESKDLSHHHHDVKVSSTGILHRCCGQRKTRIYWLYTTWTLIGLIMLHVSTKIVQQILLNTDADPAADTTNSPVSRYPFLSLFLPTSNLVWKIRRGNNGRNKARENRKTILFWNHYWDFPQFQFGKGRKPFREAQCPISNCWAVPDTPEMTNEERSSMDAVIIHAPEFDVLKHVPEIHTWRRPHQRFVYMTMESPLSYTSFSSAVDKRMKNFFNWTMTYRLDSDLPRLYGFFQNISQDQTPKQKYYPIQWQEQNFLPYNEEHFFRHVLPYKSQDFYRLAERPKKVAWIVSRCDSPSHREDYVANLQQYIPVDVLGACGNIPCNTSFHRQNRLQQHDNCTAAVEQDYKFYLAFENSFCQDYVTEKFFRRISGTSLVIVLGGASYSRMAPPHSHLNALDYESPQALATHLQQLDQNQSLYLSYFWWKDYYRVHTGTPLDHASTMCKLCEMLHDPTLPPKVYPSIATWHGEKSQCWDQNNFPKVMQDLSQNIVAAAADSDDDGKLLSGNGDDHF